MDAAEYNRIRRIVFSTANDHKKGFGMAQQYLNGYRNALGPKGYTGLMAELNFYEQYRKEFSLTVAGDMGEHADFGGVYSGGATRFDVTTNLNFKKLSDYEPFIGDGIRYQIALMDRQNFQVIEVINLAFDRCGCGGLLIPIVTIFEQGGPSDSGFVMHVCSGCKGVFEPDYNMRKTQISFEQYVKNLGGFSASKNPNSYTNYSVAQYKYLRNQHPEDNLMGIAFPYHLEGLGPWAVELTFKNSVINTDLSGQLIPDKWVEEIMDIRGAQEGLNTWVDDL